MKIRNAVLRTLDGKPLLEQLDPRFPPDPNSTPVTAARVIEAACMNGPRPGEVAFTAEENVERLLVAIACHRAPVGSELEVDEKVVAQVRSAVQGLAPIIAAQMTMILDGKDVPIEPRDEAIKKEPAKPRTRRAA